MKKIDVVIPFVNGPRDSIELRYALRSIEKNIKAKVAIWLLGDCPEWITNVNHVFYERRPRTMYAKFYNLLEKLKLASDTESIGQNFIYTYDDVYFMKPATVDMLAKPRALKDYARQNEKEWFRHTDAGVNWVSCMIQTLQQLKQENLPLYNYETHLPRVYNRGKVSALLDKYDYRRFAFQFATMYFNNYETNPELLSENKFFKLGIYHPVGYKALLDKASDSVIMNIARAYDDSLNVLECFFPEKSKYEK